MKSTFKRNWWKYSRKMAVILATVLMLQSLPIRAAQDGQRDANGGNTGISFAMEQKESGTGDGSGAGNVSKIQGENGKESEIGSGSEGGGGSGTVDGSEGGDGSGSGSEGGDGTEDGTGTPELEFEYPQPDAQDYTIGYFVNTVKSKDGTELTDVTMEYSIDDPEVASIDAKTGMVTFHKAGMVNITVQVKTNPDTPDMSQSLSYTLIINKAPQQIAFEKQGPGLTVLYGQEFSNAAAEVENTSAFDQKGYGDGAIAYEITSGENIASVDQTGRFTFQDGMTGTVNVKAIKEEDDCYLQAEAEYELNVAFEAIPQSPYTLLGDKVQNVGFEDWYKSTVKICPPNGYQINRSNSLTDAGWTNEIILDKDEVFDNEVIYLKNMATGGITDAVMVEEIKIDTTPPDNLLIVYDTPVVEKIKELLTFGFYNAKLEITLKAQDKASGIGTFTYWLDDPANGNGISVKPEIGKDGYYYRTFMIEPEYEGRVTFSAADNAGNVGKDIKSNGIVIDDDASILKVDYEKDYVIALETMEPYMEIKNYEAGSRQDVNLYCAGSQKLIFTIEEKYFYAEDVNISVNEKPCTLTWTENAHGSHTASLELTEDGVYVVKLSYEDPSKNGEATYTSEHIIIDGTPSEFDVKYKNPYVRASSADAPSIPFNGYQEGSGQDINLYYAGSQVLEFTIQEENFYARDVNVTVNEQPRTLNWTENADGKHTASLELKDDGAYVVTLCYNDPSQNGEILYCSEHIIIDNKAPELDIKYEEKYSRASTTAAPSVPLENYEEGSQQNVNLYYGSGQILTFTIKEENFYGEEVNVKVNGQPHTLEWTENAHGVYTASLELEAEGIHVATLQYQDPSQNKAVEYCSEHIFIDVTPPQLDITYQNKYVNATLTKDPVVRLENYEEKSREDVNLYYNESQILTFAIKEANFYEEEVSAEVNGKSHSLVWSENAQGEHIASLALEEDGDYVVKLSYEDPSKTGTVAYTSEHIIIDHTPPMLDVNYRNSYTNASLTDTPGIPLQNYTVNSRQDVNLYYHTGQILDFTIKEENFYAEEVKVWVNGEAATLMWTEKTDGEYAASLELAEEGTYIVDLEYEDLSENQKAEYTSEHIILDFSKPKIKVTYDVTDPVTNTSDLYNQVRTAVIEITDQHIYPNDNGAALITITAEDAKGGKVDFAPDCRFEQDKENPFQWKAVICFDKSARYSFKVDAGDMAGHTISYDKQTFTVDTTRPDASKFRIEYSKDYRNWVEKVLGFLSFGYYNPSATVTLTAEDETTSIVGMEYTYTRYGDESAGVPELVRKIITEEDIKYNGTQAAAQITFTADEAVQYRGNFAFMATDSAGNKSYYKTDQNTIIVIDTKDPKRKAYYSPARQVTEKESGGTIEGYDYGEGTGAILYYSDVMTLTLEVEEANFYAEDAIVTVYRDGQLLDNGDGYDYSAEKNWTVLEDTVDRHRMTLQLGIENADGNKDGDYRVEVSYKDRSHNEMPLYTSEQITIDTQKPILSLAFPEDAVIRDGVVYVNKNAYLEMTIVEHNFRAGDVEGKMTVKDAQGNEITVSAGKNHQEEEVSFAQYLNDAANWTSTGEEHRILVPLPEDARYEFFASYDDLALNAAQEPVSCIVVVDREAAAWEEIPCDRAYEGKLARMVDSMDNQVDDTEDVDQNTRFIFQGEVNVTMALTEANFFPEDVELTVERDGALLEAGKDYHYDFRDWKGDDEDSTHYTLNLVLGEGNVDHSADGDYQIKLSYADTSGNAAKQYLSHVLTIDTTEPDITVVYDNNEPHMEAFYGSGRTAFITVTDRNIRTDEIEIHIQGKDTWGNTLESAEAKIGHWVPGETQDSWTNTIIYDMDANYQVEILCPDMGGNKKVISDSFTIDKGLPSLRYEYSNSLMETFLNFITFGYYQPDVTVTVYAKEDISGMDYLVWGYEKEEGSSNVNVEKSGGTILRDEFTMEDTEYGREVRASFRLTASEAQQYRGRIHFEAADRAGNIRRETDGGRIIVLDTISPTRTVSYSPAVQIAEKETGNILTDDFNGDGTDAILYYDGPMEVTFQVSEANFYGEDVICKINGEVVPMSDWSKEGDVWQGSISLYEDGDYIFTMEYTDRSGNEMDTYTSSQITIDTVAPVIETSWATERLIQTKENINYSQEDMSVTIVIHERNFRAQDVEAVVTAVDAAGQDVSVEDYAGFLRDPLNWTLDGNMHTAVLNFPADANYTFNIQYKDLVFHSAEEAAPFAFTVDKTAPSDMTIEYSTPVLENILNAITFGFYNVHTTVTITAMDATSGVDHFVYSFLRASDVSGVNTELLNGVIEEGDITYSEGRRVATATFQIPNAELGGNTQFNGTVEFSAVDRTQIETKFVDGKRVVVDTIAPVAEVQYNEPVGMEGTTSYYNGMIEGVINVTEANFYSEDVELSVSKNGGAFETLPAAWTELGMDRHAGAFSLDGDGEYIVAAAYTDRSTNQMVEYQSDLLVVDTGDPQITVRGIGDHSANNEETIGFSVVVRDENLDPASCRLKLLAEVCEDTDQGAVFREIDLSDAGISASSYQGDSYVYTYVVENLDRDGIYTLSCEAADRAGHVVTEIVSDASQEEGMEQMMFSVNRNGSTYHLDQGCRSIIGTFAKAPMDMIVTEINPNILNVIRITLFRDEKTLVLQEGTDYRVDRTGGDGEWNSYVYTIFEKNFENDGIYRISVYSEDEARNVAENTLEQKNMEISFGIDKTLPNLIVTNLESGQTYPVENLTVNMQAEDNMRLVSMEVWLDGVSHAFWGEDEILQKSMAYEDYSFEISGESTRAHNVTVALTDAAGNRLVEEISDFYVTTDVWVQFFNNRPLFFGSVAGVTGMIAIPIIIVVMVRKRKNKD